MIKLLKRLVFRPISVCDLRPLNEREIAMLDEARERYIRAYLEQSSQS